MSRKISLVVHVLTGITLILPSYAQESPQNYLIGHNADRAELGLPPLIWVIKLVKYARRTVSRLTEDCQLEQSEGPYGENLAGGFEGYTGVNATKMWIDDEKPYYDHSSNSCTQNQECGHYIQAVWKNSEYIGYAKVVCDNGDFIFQCNCNPLGNVEAEKPY